MRCVGYDHAFAHDCRVVYPRYVAEKARERASKADSKKADAAKRKASSLAERKATSIRLRPLMQEDAEESAPDPMDIDDTPERLFAPAPSWRAQERRAARAAWYRDDDDFDPASPG
ncbi:hypothetical protein PLICRDRAFT_34253 [Plicaturopsis crispa FD-325 SS-3]|nr:hypothetical protein PLICRDRAFT_34253 [Plicaturopsis crispa FD-325 SS-3]